MSKPSKTDLEVGIDYRVADFKSRIEFCILPVFVSRSMSLPGWTAYCARLRVFRRADITRSCFATAVRALSNWVL